jgi:hypothetical protein
MLEEILYLLAYNGFAKDIGPAVATCKATWTDERIWFPYLIQQTYGLKNKTRLQILAEHTTLLMGEKLHIVLKKDGPMVYRPEERWLARLAELEAMAKSAEYPELIKTMLSIPDSTGRSLISIACENNCPKVVNELIKRGACYNQKDDRGASPCYYAYNSRLGREAFRTLPFQAEYAYPMPKGPSWLDNAVFINNVHAANLHHDLEINGQAIELIYNSAPPPKPKRLKSKLYKQQFGATGKKR